MDVESIDERRIETVRDLLEYICKLKGLDPDSLKLCM